MPFQTRSVYERAGTRRWQNLDFIDGRSLARVCASVRAAITTVYKTFRSPTVAHVNPGHLPYPAHLLPENQCLHWTPVCVSWTVVYLHCKKLKIVHTRLSRFRSWSGFLAVSLPVMWVINPPVGCHYLPPGSQLPSQPLRGLLPISLLGEQRHNGCEQFA